MSSKDDWNLETALKILQHPTIDAETWAEAVEWLLRYGPVSIRQLLLDASNTATEIQFPEVNPAYYTSEGQPVYDVKAIAKILDIHEEDAQAIIDQKENPENTLANMRFNTPGSKTVH